MKEISKISPQFSVVVPLYNKRPYIRRAVQSVLSQSLSDLELIVVDDGSVDGGSGALADVDDERLRLIWQANAGVGAARNRGVADAQAEWVAFLDADDFWLPEHLAEIAAIIARFPESGLVATGYEEVLNPGDHVMFPVSGSSIRKVDYFKEASRRIGIVHTSSVAIRRIAMMEYGGFGKFKVGEDLECWARLALHYPVAVSDRVTSAYVRGTGGAMEQLQVSQRKSSASGRTYSLEGISPSVGMLCRALENAPSLKANRSITAYINSRVYSCIYSELYCGDVEEARRFVGLLIEPLSPKIAIIVAALSLPPSWVRRGLALLRVSKKAVEAAAKFTVPNRSRQAR